MLTSSALLLADILYQPTISQWESVGKYVWFGRELEIILLPGPFLCLNNDGGSIKEIEIGKLCELFVLFCLY